MAKWNFFKDWNQRDAAEIHVDHGVVDERGRPVGHYLRVSRTEHGIFQLYAHITRNGINFGALQRDRDLGAVTLEAAISEVEEMLPAIRKRVAKAMAKRRGE